MSLQSITTGTRPLIDGYFRNLTATGTITGPVVGSVNQLLGVPDASIDAPGGQVDVDTPLFTSNGELHGNTLTSTTTITSGTGITATTGNITASAGSVSGSSLYVISGANQYNLDIDISNNLQLNGPGATNPITVSSAGAVTIPNLAGVVTAIQPGTNITVDNTDPKRPIINATGGGGSVNAILDSTSSGSQTITAPATNSILFYTIVGGGAGGGGGSSPTAFLGTGGSGGGGGSGYIVSGSIPVSTTSVITYTLGAGGVGGTAAGDTNGGPGGDGVMSILTVDGTTIQAYPGLGGIGGVLSGQGGDGGIGYYGGGGGQGIALAIPPTVLNGIGGAGLSSNGNYSGGAATGQAKISGAGGIGGGNAKPGSAFEASSAIGGNGGGPYGTVSTRSSLNPPPDPATFGCGGAGGNPNVETDSASGGGAGGQGYISYYMLPV